MRDDKRADGSRNGNGYREKREALQSELLADAFNACMEEQLSFIPPEREIARMHAFSERFQNAMEELCRTNGRLKKRELSRREFIFGFNRIAASLLLMLVIGGACVGTYLIAEHGLPGAGRDGSAETAEATEAPEEAQSTGAAEDTAAGEETAAESTGDAGSAAATDAAAQVDPEEAAFAGGTVRLADEQELPAGTGEIRTLVSSPVLDREAESVKITIGNLSEETISYRTDIELQVYLDGAWYVVPGTEEGAAAQEPRTVELEAGMAQDEEILLSGYTLDFEAEKYRAAVCVDGRFFGAEFCFETLEEGLEEALEGTLEGNPDDAGQQAEQILPGQDGGADVEAGKHPLPPPPGGPAAPVVVEDAVAAEGQGQGDASGVGAQQTVMGHPEDAAKRLQGQDLFPAAALQRGNGDDGARQADELNEPERKHRRKMTSLLF